MIGQVRGILIEKQAPWVLVEAGGVGYEMEVSLPTFHQLPEVGQEIRLHTHLLVREDAQHLYGFNSKVERQLFRELLKANGIGAKMALVILSGFSVAEFCQCITHGDVQRLTQLPGIGKKTAQRLVIDMRDRIQHLDFASGFASGDDVKTRTTHGTNDAHQDAITALISLGYKPQEAKRLIDHVQSQGLASGEIIRLALKASIPTEPAGV